MIRVDSLGLERFELDHGTARAASNQDGPVNHGQWQPLVNNFYEKVGFVSAIGNSSSVVPSE